MRALVPAMASALCACTGGAERAQGKWEASERVSEGARLGSRPGEAGWRPGRRCMRRAPLPVRRGRVAAMGWATAERPDQRAHLPLRGGGENGQMCFVPFCKPPIRPI